eukprot:PLAT9180.2.p1 GENE.PLAT9180.2~~PLAT9180.2.p1  ORF type:complete len:1657 (+),score=734.79 PLAT9180.2:53-5023(+)
MSEAKYEGDFRDDKRLKRFFNSSKRAWKRLRTVMEWMEGMDEETISAFIASNNSSLYSVIVDSLNSYQRMLRDEEDGMTDSGVFGKVTGKKQLPKVEDMLAACRVLRRLMLQCRKLFWKGWQSKSMSSQVQRFCHPMNETPIIKAGFSLLLEYIDIMHGFAQDDTEPRAMVEAVAGTALSILGKTIDMTAFQRGPAGSDGRFPRYVLEVEALLPADRPVSAADSLSMLQELLDHIVSDPVGAGQTVERFRFWWRETTRHVVGLLYPESCHQLGLISDREAPFGFRPSAPPAAQEVVLNWLLRQRVQPAWEVIAFETSSELVLEVARQAMCVPLTSVVLSALDLYRDWFSHPATQPGCLQGKLAERMDEFIENLLPAFTAVSASDPAAARRAMSVYELLIKSGTLSLDNWICLERCYARLVTQLAERAPFPLSELASFVTATICAYLRAPNRVEVDCWKPLREAYMPWLHEIPGLPLGETMLVQWREVVLYLTRLLTELSYKEFGGATVDGYSPPPSDDLTCLASIDLLKELEVEDSDTAFLLWRRTLELLPWESLASYDPKLHLKGIRVLLEVTSLMLQASADFTKLDSRRSRASGIDKSEGPSLSSSSSAAYERYCVTLGNLSPSSLFSLLGSWLFDTCALTGAEFSASRAVAFEAVLRILCMDTMSEVQPAHLSRALLLLHNGLRSKQPAVMAAIIRHARPLMALDQPGVLLLVPDLVFAVYQLLVEPAEDEEVDNSVLKPALFIMSSISALPHVFPLVQLRFSVVTVDSSGARYSCRAFADLKPAISGFFAMQIARCDELPKDVVSLAFSALSSYLAFEITSPGTLRTEDDCNALTTLIKSVLSLYQSNQDPELVSMAIALIDSLAEHFEVLEERMPDLLVLIVDALSDGIRVRVTSIYRLLQRMHEEEVGEEAAAARRRGARASLSTDVDDETLIKYMVTITCSSLLTLRSWIARDPYVILQLAEARMSVLGALETCLIGRVPKESSGLADIMLGSRSVPHGTQAGALSVFIAGMQVQAWLLEGWRRPINLQLQTLADVAEEVMAGLLHQFENFPLREDPAQMWPRVSRATDGAGIYYSFSQNVLLFVGQTQADGSARLVMRTVIGSSVWNCSRMEAASRDAILRSLYADSVAPASMEAPTPPPRSFKNRLSRGLFSESKVDAELPMLDQCEAMLDVLLDRIPDMFPARLDPEEDPTWLGRAGAPMLERLFGSESCIAGLRAFLAKEGQDSLLGFWLEVERLRLGMVPLERGVSLVFQHFLAEDATHALDLCSPATRLVLSSAIEEGELHVDMYAELQAQAMDMLQTVWLPSYLASDDKARVLTLDAEYDQLLEAASSWMLLEMRQAALMKLRPPPVAPTRKYGEEISPVEQGRLLLAQLGLVTPSQFEQLRPIRPTKTFFAKLHKLDSLPTRDVVSCGVFYVAPDQVGRRSILHNSAGSDAYSAFVTALGWEVPLDSHSSFMGRLSNSAACGSHGVYYCNSLAEVMFHDATRLPVALQDGDSLEEKENAKLARVASDAVMVVWNECHRQYWHGTLSNPQAKLTIIITPLTRTKGEMCHVQLFQLGIRPLVPLVNGQLVPRSVLPTLVRYSVIQLHRQLSRTGVTMSPCLARGRVLASFTARHSTAVADYTALKGQLQRVLGDDLLNGDDEV